jgi:hypothetical protein
MPINMTKNGQNKPPYSTRQTLILSRPGLSKPNPNPALRPRVPSITPTSIITDS